MAAWLWVKPGYTYLGSSRTHIVPFPGCCVGYHVGTLQVYNMHSICTYVHRTVEIAPLPASPDDACLRGSIPRHVYNRDLCKLLPKYGDRRLMIIISQLECCPMSGAANLRVRIHTEPHDFYDYLSHRMELSNLVTI